MHLKTGQIDDVVSVVGYVQAKSGKRYAAVFIANQRAIHRGRGHKLRDAVLNWIFTSDGATLCPRMAKTAKATTNG